MSRRRDEPPPRPPERFPAAGLPRELRNLYIVVGLLLLAVGFLAGYVAGTESAHAPQPMVAALPAPAHPAAAAAAGGTPKYGHTFTGNVEVPPHSDDAHKLADVLLANVQCPCGSCSNQTIPQCGCDASKEIAGVAAHLLERGNSGDAVIQRLATMFGVQATPALLASVASIRLENPQLIDAPSPSTAPAMAPALAPAPGERSSAPVPDDIASVVRHLSDAPTVGRLTDVPTNARPRPAAAGLAATVLDASAVPAGAADVYAIARRIPEVLAGLACTCGCMTRLGHESLLTCYQSTHAVSCPICQARAREADRLAAQGVAVADIRAALDRMQPTPGP